MKNTSSLLRYSKTASALLVAALATSSALTAQTWDGGDATNGSWAVANNWNPNGVPAFTNTTDLVFNNMTRATTNTYYGGTTRLVRSLTFGANIDGTWTTTTLTGSILTFSSSTGTASLNVDADATADISFSGGVGATGFQRLSSQLELNHNGTGLFLWNRQTDGTGGITKTGSGTFSISAPNANSFTGPVNVNAGRLIMGSTASATGDLNTSSGISLGGGVLEIRTTSALNKQINPNLTVSGASTLAYNNTAATDQSLTVQTGTMALNANLTVQNISSSVAGNNIVNISRNLTGSGDLTVDTYNNISSGGSSYSLGRVQLSGDNSGWSGNLLVAKGTAQLSGPNSSGTGGIFIGTTANAFGAGLAINQASDLSIANNITVRSGGFRGIKHNNQSAPANVTFNGNVLLEGDLNVDHSLMAPVDGYSAMIFNGTLSGAGGLSITRSVGDIASGVVLNGTNSYLGTTTVASGAALGGNGLVVGNISFAAGANWLFSTSATLDVTGNVTFGGFGVSNLIGLSNTTVAGTYVLMNGTGSNINTTNVSNIGAGSAFDLGNQVYAYFDLTGGDFALTVSAIPEPGSFALLGGLLALGFVGSRRRRAK